jgi:AcrR family transcriptional regulator
MTGPQGLGSAPCITVERLCRVAEVSRASFYRHWHETEPRTEETAIRDAIQRLCLTHRHYGYRRITALLRREGWHVNHKRVLRLMREDNLLCLRHRPFVPATTDSRHGWQVMPNLARGVRLTGIDQLWVADITYVRLAEAFVYLAVILDAFSRKVVGWALEEHLRSLQSRRSKWRSMFAAQDQAVLSITATAASNTHATTTSRFLIATTSNPA